MEINVHKPPADVGRKSAFSCLARVNSTGGNMKRIVVVMAAVLFFAVACTADVLNYQAILSGSIESPPNASAGTGVASINYDTVAHTLALSIVFSGLTGTTTASHIHCCTATPFTGTAGVATTLPTFTGFPRSQVGNIYQHSRPHAGEQLESCLRDRARRNDGRGGSLLRFTPR